MSVGWYNTYEGRKVSRVAMCEVRSRKNGQEPKKKKKKKRKSTVVSSKKKSTVMSPIRRRMKKRNPSSGQNGQLVHWWLLIHSGPNPALMHSLFPVSRANKYNLTVAPCFLIGEPIHLTIGLGDLLLVVSHLFAVPVLVINFMEADFRMSRVTY